MAVTSSEPLLDVVNTVLESARSEVIRRMKALGLPLSIPQQQLVVRDHDNGGWETDVVVAQVNGLHADGAVHAIRDESVRHRALGLAPQLAPLAEYLAENTDLATRRYAEYGARELPAADVLMFRCVNPLAFHYLMSLGHLETGDSGLVAQLAGELAALISGDDIRHVHQLVLAGLRLTGVLQHGNVTARPLSGHERGAWLRHMPQPSDPIPGSDFVPFTSLYQFMPETLVEGVTTRPIGEQFDKSRLPYRIVLAFFMLGYDLSGSNVVSHFDWPRWASFGANHTPYPLGERMVVEKRELTQDQFTEVVELALMMPDFGPHEADAHEIALYRTLLGCARWRDPGFLDFAIALEAALLSGQEAELAYKFSLYGALFLRGALDPRETFDRLRNIYAVRSKLVHGEPTKPHRRTQAYNDAPLIATAVMRKAVESGWPDTKSLDSVALRPD